MTFYLTSPYTTPEGNSRFSWYGFSGTPSAMFDGVSSFPGGAASGSMFASYNPAVFARLSVSSPLIMSAEYVALGNEISFSANIQVDEAIANTNNVVSFFVCQEDLHGQSNMVVEVLANEAFTLDTVGQSTIINGGFTLDPEYTEEALRLIILVQNSSTKEILQATVAIPNYAGSLAIDCVPDGVDAPWHLQGAGGMDITGNGDKTINVFYTGDYTVNFIDIPMWTSPTNNPQTQTLVEDGVLTFTGLYTDGPFEVVAGAPIADTGSGQGVALIDYDNDGDLDIHVVNDGTADQLLRNDGDLTFSDAATGLLADTGAGRGCAWADFNSDGNQDVFIGRNDQTNILLAGDGAGGFMAPNCYGIDDPGSASSVSWVDYDLDGYLDIYVANRNQSNLLLNNQGYFPNDFFLFSNVAGPTANGEANSSGANWLDLNNDQRLDLYIVNSFNPNAIFNNTALGFDNMTSGSGIDDSNNGMGSAWGDYDNDGDFDLYLSNGAMADHIFNNSGGLLFNPILGDNTSDMGHGRGVVWADFNNDTNLDAYVVRHNQRDLFLLGDGTGNFQQIPVGPAEADGPGNAIACGDLDGDGDIDVFITRDGQSNVLLSNNMSGENNFLELSLTGSANLPDAIGTIVRLTIGGVTQMRHLSAGSGYLAMDAKTIHFGLADASTIDSVEITWPDGTVQTLTNLAANQFLSVTLGENPLSSVEDDQPLPRATVLGQAHPNPFNPSTTIAFSLAQSGPTRLDIFTVDGRRVRTLVSENLNAGQHSVTWTGKDDSGLAVASGAYFYRLLSADGKVQTGRMALVK